MQHLNPPVARFTRTATIRYGDVEISGNGPDGRGIVRQVDFHRPEIVTAQRRITGELVILDLDGNERELLLTGDWKLRDDQDPTVHYPVCNHLRLKLEAAGA